MLRALARYCQYRGIKDAPEHTLRNVVTQHRGDVDGSVWSDTLLVAAELGVLSNEAGVLQLDGSSIRELAVDDDHMFRRALRRRVMAYDHNHDPWDTVDGRWSSAGAREFSRIATWLLQVPVEVLQTNGPYELARKEVSGPSDDKLVENQTQWRTFLRWGIALGLVSMIDDLVLPDPTVAIEEELSDLLAGEVHVIAFRDGVVKCLPVLLGGAYAHGLDGFLHERPRRDPRAAGSGLSLALRRLERRGVISVDRRSDAEHLALDGLVRQPTHLARATPAGVAA
jgi:hypothetical protein